MKWFCAYFCLSIPAIHRRDGTGPYSRSEQPCSYTPSGSSFPKQQLEHRPGQHACSYNNSNATKRQFHSCISVCRLFVVMPLPCLVRGLLRLGCEQSATVLYPSQLHPLFPPSKSKVTHGASLLVVGARAFELLRALHETPCFV